MRLRKEPTKELFEGEPHDGPVPVCLARGARCTQGLRVHRCHPPSGARDAAAADRPEATAFIGAEPHQRTDARTNLRNGTRSKTITTAAGDVDLGITKLRQGAFFPRCWNADAGSTRHCSRW